MDDKRLLLDVAAPAGPDGQLAAVLTTNSRLRESRRGPAVSLAWEGTDAHHVGQFVQNLVDLLAVREADVGLPHQTPHFLPDVVFVQLNKQ